MDIYTKKSRWKIYLALTGAIIVLISLVYTSYIANEIAIEERQQAKQWAGAISVLGQSFGEDSVVAEMSIQYIFDIVTENKNIPAIITNEFGEVVDFVNFDTSKVNLNRQLALMRSEVGDSIPVKTRYYSNYVHYKNSRLLAMLKFFPFFQLGLIALFIGISYWLFNWARRSEQNQVWIGLAKETAHQLGTPISGIVAWIEHLKLMAEGNEEINEIADEMRDDVKRLEEISERFSKIGAIPELETQNILTVVHKNMSYMKRRAPRRVEFEYQETDPPILANFNAPLFDWVLENLLRNALDAMSREGKVTSEVFETEDSVIIDITDTGKGIPPAKFKTIFKPGFSTKKRGWGLGLSLTQRIIKNYHNGRIFVKQSEVDQGTTFRIELPKKV